MIKPTDFRISNLVMDELTGEWMIIDEIGKNIGATLINREKYPLPDGWQMTPIPITPEILESCGFERQNNGWRLKKDRHNSMHETTFGMFDHNYCNGKLDLRLNISDGPTPKIKYLHQLQNLYHSLTGTELPVKQKV